MSFPWQETIAIVLAAVAAGYLAYRAYRTLARKKSGGCGSCSTCPTEVAGETIDEKPLVTLKIQSGDDAWRSSGEH